MTHDKMLCSVAVDNLLLKRANAEQGGFTLLCMTWARDLGMPLVLEIQIFEPQILLLIKVWKTEFQRMEGVPK